MRDAVAGREHEFLGLGLIGLGVLLGLAIYVNLAGPLGRGTETLFGWLAGLGRYAVPVILVAVGISLVRRGKTASAFRLAVGWTMVGGAALGLLQVLRGPDEFTTEVEPLEQAGGWLGVLVARAARSADRPGRRRCPAGARAARRSAADHADVDAHDGIAHGRVPRHRGHAAAAVDPVGSVERHDAQQRPCPRLRGHRRRRRSRFGRRPTRPVRLRSGRRRLPGRRGRRAVAKRSRSTKPKVSVGSQPGVASADGARVGEWILPPDDVPRPARRAGDRPQGSRGPRPDAAGVARPRTASRPRSSA